MKSSFFEAAKALIREYELAVLRKYKDQLKRTWPYVGIYLTKEGDIQILLKEEYRK